MGNFVSLHEVVKAVADRIMISDEEADRCSRRRPASAESPFETMLARSQIKGAMARSRAAGALLEPLNRPQGQRPDWYDSSPGYPKLKDAVADRGMDILIALSRTESSLWRNVPCDQQVGLGYGGQELLPAHSIGFEIDKLVSHLKSVRVPHSLTSRNSTGRRSRNAKSPPIISAPTMPDLAPYGAVDLAESESLTAYISRVMPPPSRAPEPIEAQLVNLEDVSVLESVALGGREPTLAGGEAAVGGDTSPSPPRAIESEDRFLYPGTYALRAGRVSVCEPAVLMAHKGMRKDMTRFNAGAVWLELKRLYEHKLCPDLKGLERDRFTVESIHGEGFLTRSQLSQLLKRWQMHLGLS